MYPLFFLVSFLASVAGAICGIGGGVIIKPLLDSFNVLSVSVISFLSGCTVLSMSVISVIKAKRGSGSLLEMRISTPLAIGAAIGGVAGKSIFQYIAALFGNDDQVGAVQAGCLIIITVGTLVYTVFSKKIKTLKLTNLLVCLVIGLVLGVLSSFLGIGGGPINLVVLYYFFSMETKTAAQNSIYIIMFSQITSLLNTLLTKTVPDCSPLLLVLMVGGGILGGICGGRINKTIQSKTVSKLFIFLMVVIIGINIYNLMRFTGMI